MKYIQLSLSLNLVLKFVENNQKLVSFLIKKAIFVQILNCHEILGILDVETKHCSAVFTQFKMKFGVDVSLVYQDFGNNE